jgi:SAM-dependent methyltransferase
VPREIVHARILSWAVPPRRERYNRSMHEASRRVRALYEGERGRWWRRIETGRPATWAEENAVQGRAQLVRRLIDWMGPLGDRRVLDAGCGSGTLARALAAAGARVVGIDLVERFVVEGAGAEGVELRCGDVCAAARAGDPPFDDIVLIEVLEDYAAEEQRELLRRIAERDAPRIWLAFRSAATGAARLLDLLPVDPRPAIDPVELLRSLHTGTPYRLRRREVIENRTWRAHLTELNAGGEGVAT